MPIQYVDATGNNQFKIGDVNPDFSFGWSNNLRVKGFGVYALFDGQKGGQIYNFTKQWMFQDFRHGDKTRAARRRIRRSRSRSSSAASTTVSMRTNTSSRDGSYMKLRELSVSYSMLGVRQLELSASAAGEQASRSRSSAVTSTPGRTTRASIRT